MTFQTPCNSTAITFDVKIPVTVNIDPDVIVQYLKEKFQELCKIQNEIIPQTDSIQSLQDIIEGTCASDNELYDDRSGPLRVRVFDE